MKRLLDHAAIDEPTPKIAIPRLGSLDSLDLPVTVTTPKVVREEVLDNSAEMDEITDLALDAMREILSLRLNPEDENFQAILRQKGATAAAALTAQVRVDENRFKKKSVDKLGELLELIRGEEAKLIQGRILN